MSHMLMCICVFNEVYACVCRCLFVPDPEEFSSLSLGGMYARICSSAFISVCFLNVYEKDGAREGATSQAKWCVEQRTAGYERSRNLVWYRIIGFDLHAHTHTVAHGSAVSKRQTRWLHYSCLKALLLFFFLPFSQIDFCFFFSQIYLTSLSFFSFFSSSSFPLPVPNEHCTDGVIEGCVHASEY